MRSSGISTIRAAVVAWRLREITRDGDFFAHFYDLVSVAHAEGAELVVIPEDQTLELLQLAPDLEENDVPEFLCQFSNEIEAWIARISQSSGMTIIGGSHLRKTSDGFEKVCAVGHPKYGCLLQPKLQPTVYESETWGLQTTSHLNALPDPTIGVTTGFDAASPSLAEKLCDAGMLVQAVPAFAKSRHDFQLVRWASRSRASENLCYVLHSSLVGTLEREPVPQAFGTAAILTPSTTPFPEKASLGESLRHEERVLLRTLNLDLLREARTARASTFPREGKLGDVEVSPFEVEDERA